jgi:membrane-associated PAP2 superfamily phosphatase
MNNLRSTVWVALRRTPVFVFVAMVIGASIFPAIHVLEGRSTLGWSLVSVACGTAMAVFARAAVVALLWRRPPPSRS